MDPITFAYYTHLANEAGDLDRIAVPARYLRLMLAAVRDAELDPKDEPDIYAHSTTIREEHREPAAAVA